MKNNEKNRADFYLDFLCHDINNINQILLLYLQLLKQNKCVEDKKCNKFLDGVFYQSYTLSRLVKNILTLTRLEKEEPNFLQIQLKSMLQKVMTKMQTSRTNKKIEIKITSEDESEIKILSHNLLEEVFINILDNAIKFDKNKIINIEIIIAKENKVVRIELLDNGIGIPDEMKEEVFQRLDSFSPTKGTGLGLAVVKKIITLCNGKVWIENINKFDYTKGSKVILILPNNSLLSY